jgi:EAL domain-containing protein (putative c-di-GMP-specific phosphodiesterase class I)
VDYLKIDGSFIRDMLDDPMDMALVESINQIGHVMGIKTIAEFVDSREKLMTMKTFGLDYTQGFYLHRSWICTRHQGRRRWSSKSPEQQLADACLTGSCNA